MDTNAVATSATVSRKRSGRPPKLVSVGATNRANTSLEPMTASGDNDLSSTLNVENSSNSSSEPIEIDGSALALSPIPDEQLAASASGGTMLAVAAASSSGECRRSSRKKIIKFDVRDLLNKNRKPHKIQIEARIDSNAPTTSKSAAAAGASSSAALASANSSIVGGNVCTSTSDLTSKQKTFIEKSAIFRRFSISENKVPPLRPHALNAGAKLTLLGKSGVEGGALNSNTAPALDPSKIAQARRLSRTQEMFSASLMKSKQNSSLIVAQMESSSNFVPNLVTSAQKKNATVGRRKNAAKPNRSELKNVLQASGTQKRRGRPPKNKTLLEKKLEAVEAQVKTENEGDKVEESPKTYNVKDKLAKVELAVNEITPPTDESTTFAPSTSTVDLTITQRPMMPEEDVILEISSSSSMSASSEQEFLSMETKGSARRSDVNESQQRNFAAVWFLQESPSVNDNVNAPEFIVAAVEEIIAEQPTEIANAADIEDTIQMEQYESMPIQRDIIEIDENEAFAIVTDTGAGEDETVVMPEPVAKHIPSTLLGKSLPASRTSSSSESDATSSNSSNSERSNKPYKKGDKLRVSLKRMAMPQSSAASSGLMTGSDMSNSNANGNSSSGSGNGSDTSSVKQTEIEKREDSSDEGVGKLSTIKEKCKESGIAFDDGENRKQVEQLEEPKFEVASQQKLVQQIVVIGAVEETASASKVATEAKVEGTSTDVDKHEKSEKPRLNVKMHTGDLAKQRGNLMMPCKNEDNTKAMKPSRSTERSLSKEKIPIDNAKIMNSTEPNEENAKQDADMKSNELIASTVEGEESAVGKLSMKLKTHAKLEIIVKETGTKVDETLFETTVPVHESSLQEKVDVRKLTEESVPIDDNQSKELEINMKSTETNVLTDIKAAEHAIGISVNKSAVEDVKVFKATENTTSTSGDYVPKDGKSDVKLTEINISTDDTRVQVQSCKSSKVSTKKAMQRNDDVKQVEEDNSTKEKAAQQTERQVMENLDIVKEESTVNPLPETTNNVESVVKPAPMSPVKKERITLPLKKQMSKFKCFEAAIADDPASNMTVDMIEAKAPLPVVDTSTDAAIIKHVSVETSTLLDILKTVQMNQETAAAKVSAEITDVSTAAQIDLPIEAGTSQNMQGGEKSTTTSDQIAALQLDELPTTAAVNPIKKPIEQLEIATVSQTSITEPKTSPTRTDTISPQTIRKVTRRYERRQRRADETTHKTLEETFAEIAAQSSKEILELQCRELYSYEEEKNRENNKDNNSGAALELESVTQASLEPTIDEAVKFVDNTIKHETVSQSAVETASPLPRDVLDVNIERTIVADNVLKSDEILAEGKLESDVKEITRNTELKTTMDDFKDAVDKTEPATDLSQQTVNPIEQQINLEQQTLELTNISTTVECDAPYADATSVTSTSTNTTTTPARRGRKPKNKHVETKSIANKEEQSPLEFSVEMPKEVEEGVGKVDTSSTEKPGKLKKSKSMKEENSEKSTIATETKPTELTETLVPLEQQKLSDTIAPTTAAEDVPSGRTKEERTPRPPKKRLLKLQMELEQVSDEIIASVDTPSSTPKDVGNTTNSKKATSQSVKEHTSKKTKKSSGAGVETKDVNVNKSEEGADVASSTPITKRGKNKQKAEHTAEELSTSGKKKHRKIVEQIKLKTDKLNTTSKSQSDKKEKFKEKEKTTSDFSSKKSEKKKFLEMEEAAAQELHKKIDEKTAKKKRQKKLKEAFEAALSEEDAEKPKIDILVQEPDKTDVILPLTNTPERRSPVHVLPMTPTECDIKPIEGPTMVVEPVTTPMTVTAAEEDPDPLKDIEKFIEDGVNLLKRDYKIEDDSVNEVIHPTKTLSEEIDSKPERISDKATEQIVETGVVIVDTGLETSTLSEHITELSMREHPKIDLQQSLYETPADTPIATPTATPPPKSPIMDISVDEISGVRRSHRIKQITKTPKALVGRGLVRDKERFSLKDDVETKTHYTLDDHLTDLAEVEAKNAKFLKDMEERLSNFHVIKENEYKCERVISREARKMICDCFLTMEEEERGELGCGEDCLNRLLMIECGPDCNVKDRCTNKRFQKLLCSPCRVFRTEKKGFGIMADVEILPGEFIMEYVGEVIDGDEFERRRNAYSQDKNRHYYFMALRSDAIIDATIKGNISRFINHSCDPNAETQKWTVNGELRIGFFSRKSIMPGEEITFDYQYQRYGREAQRCYCESANCRGWIGEEPNSDEGEQVDGDSDVENLAGLLDSDDEDSDESVADAEEVKKKLEIAAAEAKLTPIEEDLKSKLDDKSDAGRDKKKKLLTGDDERKETDEDSKIKIKKLLSKMAEKVAKKKDLTQKEKKQRKRRVQSPNDGSSSKSRYLEDPDIEDEVHFLSRCGLKNQSDTLRLSRLMVRAKLPQTRLNLLQILRKGELPCRRLFLDYHGLRLLHGWMSEDGGDMNIRLSLLETLESLPIANKTVLTDSKVYQSVRNWCGKSTVVGGATVTAGGSSLSPSDESSKESSSSNSHQDATTVQEVPSELQKLASKLTSTWDSLPEIFRIPKRERIEQMKEHEREADRQYAAAVEDSNRSQTSDRYQRDRFGRGLVNRYGKPYGSKDARNIVIVGATTSSDPRRRSDNGSYASMSDGTRHLSKEQRREMFAAKVARDEAEKRLAEERREFETKCRFFGLDPKKTRLQEVPFCVNPATGQWYSVERQPIPTPPSYAHVQVHVKPKSTDPADYQLPAVVTSLPAQWKFAITPQGNIYYYHVHYRIPQWEPPTAAQLAADGITDATGSGSDSEGTTNDSTDDDDEVLLGMDQAQLKAYIEKKVERRRQKRYNRLVDERAISPRREEDRIYNQIEVRKYKENKEKIRKRKEEIRRRRAEALKSGVSISADESGVASTSAVDSQAGKSGQESDDELSGAIPIQDYLLSSDEEDEIKAECNNSPLIDKIVQGDKIVDELDALKTKRPLKRALPPHRELSTQASGSSSNDKYEYKKRKLEKKDRSKKSKDSDSKYRRLKEKFRCEIAGIIVHHLKPYRKDSCPMGRIQSDEDFNHLARKLTHFVMIKELKYCESVGQTLVVTESVKNKSREFIKKYMAKYGETYVKPTNDPEFKEIPFTI